MNEPKPILSPILQEILQSLEQLEMALAKPAGEAIATAALTSVKGVLDVLVNQVKARLKVEETMEATDPEPGQTKPPAAHKFVGKVRPTDK